jgi:putative hemolysin
MEDMLEELVGDINDEDQPSEQAIVRRDDGTYLVDGLLPFVDLQERLRLPSVASITSPHDFETVAGFVLALLGRMAAVGDVVRWEGYTLEVVDMDGHRIDKILLRPPQVGAGKQTEGILAQNAVTPAPAPDDMKKD